MKYRGVKVSLLDWVIIAVSLLNFIAGSLFDDPVSITVGVIGIVIGVCMLEETHERKRKKQNP